MADEVAYVKKRGKEGQAPRQVYKGRRRQAVASLLAEGLSHRKIAEQLGIGKTTVARDIKYLKSSEHILRAQETADKIVESGLETTDVPTSVVEWREMERANVIDLIHQRHTYEQIAKKIGVSLSTVVRHVNSYLQEYGDWGGRTQLEWRNEHLVRSYELMAKIEMEMEMQPTRGQDAMGDEAGWDLTPAQAAKIRSDARKEYMQAMAYQGKLLQLLVSKTEVEVEQKVVVMRLGNVDLSAFPPQDASQLVIDG